MADVELVINIDEKEYEQIKKDIELLESKFIVVPTVYKIIANGKPQPTGHWIIKKDCEGKTRRCVCDKCGNETGPYTWTNPNFCDNCGARMVESEEK